MLQLVKYPELRALTPSRAAGIIVPFGVRDKLGNYWVAASDFALDSFSNRPLFHHHTARGDLSRHGTLIDESIEVRDDGLFAEFVIDDVAYRAISEGNKAYSTGAYRPGIRVDRDGRVTRWPILETSWADDFDVVSPLRTTDAYVVAVRAVWPGIDFANNSVERGVWMEPNVQAAQDETPPVASGGQNDAPVAAVPPQEGIPIVSGATIVAPVPAQVAAPPAQVDFRAIESRLAALENAPTRHVSPAQPVPVDPVISVRSKFDDASLLGMLFLDQLRVKHAFARQQAPPTRSVEWLRAMYDKVSQRVVEDAKHPEGRVLGKLKGVPIREVSPYRAIDTLCFDVLNQSYDGFAFRADEVMKTDFTNFGLEMIPTLLSAVAYHFFRLKSQVFGNLTTFDMPSNPFKWPKFTSGPTIRRVLEMSDQVQANIASSTIPASKPGTADVTFSAGKIGALTFYSDEELQSSSIPWAEALALEYVNAMAKGADWTVINGDETASTLNISHLGTDPTGTDYDRVLTMDGLRHMAFNVSNDAAAEATWAKTTPGVLQQKMGSRGIIGRDIRSLFMAMDPGSSYKADALDAYESLADVGAQATLITGQVGQVKGVPIVVSDEIEDSDANGKYPADHTSGTTGSTLMIHRDIVRIGRWRQQLLDSMAIPLSEGWALWSTVAFDVQQMEDGGVTLGYNTAI
ncbi:MAG: hypothetical protein ABFS03_03945 [Chloroflexota bacterium]